MTSSRQRHQVAVVIVAYNSAGTIRDCLAGVLDHSLATKVIVVDNSQDSATSKIVISVGEADSRVTYISAPRNLGFAGGCNLGAEHVTNSPFIAFINPDVSLNMPLDDLVDVAKASDVAIVAARLTSSRDKAGVNARPRATITRELLNALVGTRAYRINLSLCPRVGTIGRRVDQLDGALLVMETEVFHALGGFDERFELYYEDVDICVRAGFLGGCVLLDVQCGTHVGGVSSSSVSALAFCLLKVSRVRYLRKHYAFPGVGLLAALIACLEFVTRSVGRKSEGAVARRQALTLQLTEVRRPGSANLLR